MAVLAVVLSACAQPQGNPTAAVSASPAQSASQAPASPTAVPDLPLTNVGFSCRLPVYDSEGSTITDGFIQFPTGDLTIDPSGGGKGMYFDEAYSRWLPTWRQAISPDGTRYAYVEISQETGIYFIHIVDVATGTDRSIRQDINSTGVNINPTVFDYSSAGIYLVGGFEHIWPGVWLFDPVSGATHRVADVERPEVMGPGGALWFGEVNAADPSPFSPASSAGIFPDEIGRFDLKSGARSTWLYRPGKSVEVIGADISGKPLIRFLAPGSDPGIASMGFFDHSASELLIGLDANSQKSIYKGPLVETLGKPIADAHGVWFGGTQGIYFYSEAAGLVKVSNHPGYPANGCF